MTASAASAAAPAGRARIVEHRFHDLPACARAFADTFAARIQDAIDARGRALIALSGGRTPRALYPVLARRRLDWANVTCTLTDERWVPADHPESNERMIRD